MRFRVKELLVCGIVALCGLPVANAAVLCIGTVANVTINQGDIAVYVTAASGSPCASGWFYSFVSDTDDMTVNRMLAILLTASATGSSITLYGAAVTCNDGTSSRFTGINDVPAG